MGTEFLSGQSTDLREPGPREPPGPRVDEDRNAERVVDGKCNVQKFQAVDAAVVKQTAVVVAQNGRSHGNDVSDRIEGRSHSYIPSRQCHRSFMLGGSRDRRASALIIPLPRPRGFPDSRNTARMSNSVDTSKPRAVRICCAERETRREVPILVTIAPNVILGPALAVVAFGRAHRLGGPKCAKLMLRRGEV
jgi:hypothetical protein